MFIFLLILLLIAIILEGSLTTLPLVLICLLCLTIIKRDAFGFLIAFIAGLLLDTFALRPLGWTSVFLLIFVLLILLYQRKYEIYSYQFVMTAAFLGAALFLWVFGYNDVWLQAGIAAFIGLGLFAMVRIFNVERGEGKGSHPLRSI